MAPVLDALPPKVKKMLMKKMKEQLQMLNKKLMKKIKEEGKMLLGVPKEINKMRVKLDDLKNFLTDADNRNITEKRVQALVTELRDALSDGTDIIKSWELKARDQGPSKDMGSRFGPLLFCLRNPLHSYNIGRRLKKLNKKLSDINARGELFNFTNLGFYDNHRREEIASPPSTRETSGDLDESGLVGEEIEEDTTKPVEQENNKIARGINAVEPHHRVDKIEPESASSLLKEQNLEGVEKTTTSAASGVKELDSARKVVGLQASKEKKE